MNILDPRFKYTPSISTDVWSTWTKFGFKPTTEDERIARQTNRARAPYRQGEDPDVSIRICARASGAH